MLGETGRREVAPICGNGDFLAYGFPRITAPNPHESLPRLHVCKELEAGGGCSLELGW